MGRDVELFMNDALDASIRIVMEDDEPWFVATDVCNFLGTQTKDVPSILTKNDFHLDTIEGNRGARNYIVISEPGLYKLVFRSRKPAAEAFTDWVTRDVLPTLRKTGHYGNAPVPTIREALEGWLEEVKAHEQTKLERDEAIRTKAHINNKKTATALAHTGQLSKKCKKLEEENKALRKENADLHRAHNCNPVVLQMVRELADQVCDYNNK